MWYKATCYSIAWSTMCIILLFLKYNYFLGISVVGTSYSSNWPSFWLFIHFVERIIILILIITIYSFFVIDYIFNIEQHNKSKCGIKLKKETDGRRLNTEGKPFADKFEINDLKKKRKRQLSRETVRFIYCVSIFWLFDQKKKHTS